MGGGVNVPLNSYLIQPVQRIPRYRLLVHELLKCTPESHIDYAELRAALHSIEDIALVVNESIREAEYMNQLVELKKKFTGAVPEILAPKRFLVREGNLMKVCRKEPKPRQFFLLNDMLIYATQNITPTPTGGRYRFHDLLPLEFTSVQDTPDKPSQRNAFQFLSKSKSFTVFAESPEEKALWLSDVQKCLSALQGGDQGPNSSEALAPVWAPDQDSKVCLLCEVKFTTLNRRHHCRQCGTLCCGACSGQKLVLKNIGKSCRVCFRCYEAVTGKQAPLKKAKGSVRREDSASGGGGSRTQLAAMLSSPSAADARANADRQIQNERALFVPSVPTAPPAFDPELDYSSGSDFYDSEDELWEPPTKPAPKIPI